MQNQIYNQTAVLALLDISHIIAEHEVIAPIVYTMPLQLKSSRVAMIKNINLVQPRNFAKSVMVV